MRVFLTAWLSACGHGSAPSTEQAPRPQLNIAMASQDDYPAHEYAEHSYFRIDEATPPSCFVIHPRNPLHAGKKLHYQTPAEYCESPDNYGDVNFQFACVVEDCRETYAGEWWCPEIKVMNCAAFMCVINRSEDAVEEHENKAAARSEAGARREYERRFPYDPLKVRPEP